MIDNKQNYALVFERWNAEWEDHGDYFDVVNPRDMGDVSDIKGMDCVYKTGFKTDYRGVVESARVSMSYGGAEFRIRVRKTDS